MVSNIMHQFDHHQILSNFQHGFLEGHSRETQLIAFADNLAKEMQNGEQSNVIVMDFSKAFDNLIKCPTRNCSTNCQTTESRTLP